MTHKCQAPPYRPPARTIHLKFSILQKQELTKKNKGHVTSKSSRSTNFHSFLFYLMMTVDLNFFDVSEAFRTLHLPFLKSSEGIIPNKGGGAQNSYKKQKLREKTHDSPRQWWHQYRPCCGLQNGQHATGRLSQHYPSQHYQLWL